MTSNRLTASRVENALTTRRFGRPCYAFDVLDSTNSYLLARVGSETGWTEGALVIAGFQSRGKGRRRRQWEAPPDSSLLTSLLFRPPWPADESPRLLMLAALALQTAVSRHTPLEPALKWPNDLVLLQDGEYAKLAGLLLETGVGPDPFYVLGAGLNVNIPRDRLPQSARPATSIQAALGRPVSRLPLLVTYLAEIERRYEDALAGRSPFDEWAAALVTTGQEVTVRPFDGGLALEGVASGVAPDGRLLVRDRHGHTHLVAAGDVTLARY